MPLESITQRTNKIPDHVTRGELYMLLTDMRSDLETLRVFCNTHVHGGVTTGAGNTAVPTTTISSLTTRP